jgi:hypothetical protein
MAGPLRLPLAGDHRQHVGEIRRELRTLREVLGAHLRDEIDGQDVRRAFAGVTKNRGRFAANRALSALALALRLAADAG